MPETLADPADDDRRHYGESLVISGLAASNRIYDGNTTAAGAGARCS
jgi:hypothetical protein